MKRLYVVVEGQTEEEFVKDVLLPHLQEHSVFAVPIIVRTRRDTQTGAILGKGGGRWKHWSKDLTRLLGEHSGGDVAFTTLIDLYGLPDDFPQIAKLLATQDTSLRAAQLEEVMFQQFKDHRFIPYIQRHEFEALVLASLGALLGLLDAPADVKGLKQLQGELLKLAPEDVNDGAQTAPSKRLKTRIPGYGKTLHGPMAVAGAGLSHVRALCPRFNAWVTKLESLAVGKAQ